MANQIRMTPDTMRTRAGEYTAQGQKLQEIITKMDNLLGNCRVNGKEMPVGHMQRSLHSSVQVL